jgi:hypothetical protein
MIIDGVFVIVSFVFTMGFGLIIIFIIHLCTKGKRK